MICNLCAKFSKNYVLLNGHYKDLIFNLLTWLKYKYDVKNYDRICEDCYGNILDINKFAEIIQRGQLKLLENDNKIETPPFRNDNDDNQNKRRRCKPKHLEDDSVLLTENPISITMHNTIKDVQHLQKIAELYMEELPQKVLASIYITKSDNNGKCIFVCGFCQKNYYRDMHVKQHVIQHLENLNLENIKELPYKCVKCEKVFKRQYPVKRHFNNTHNLEKSHKCNQCFAVFKHKNNLNYHMARHNNVKAFKCSVCGKPFILRYELLLHMRKHTGEKPYKCSICTNSFAYRSNFMKHHRLCIKKNGALQSNETDIDRQKPLTQIEESTDNDTDNDNDVISIHEEQIMQETEKSTSEKAKSLLNPNVLKESKQINKAIVKLDDNTRIQSNLNCGQRDLIPCNGIKINLLKDDHIFNHDENNVGIVYQDSRLGELDISKKSFANQNNSRELDSKVIIQKVEILPSICITPSASLPPIQSLLQTPLNCKYQCLKCYKYFKRSYAFNKHMKMHRDKEQYQCRALPDVQNYRNHKSPIQILTNNQMKLSKSSMNLTCSSPTYSIVSDPDPDGKEIMQQINAHNMDNANDNISELDDSSLSSPSLENNVWEEALDKVLLQPAIIQNIRNNLNLTIKPIDDIL